MRDNAGYSLKKKDVYRFTIQFIKLLPLVIIDAKYKTKDLFNVLVFAASFRISVSQSCKNLQEAPPSSLLMENLAYQITDIERLQRGINERLAALLPKKFGHRGRQIAIDLVKIPYHGTVDPEHEGEVCRSKAQSGTTHFFIYATVCAIWRSRRYTLALYRVRAEYDMARVLKMLMRRLLQMGIHISLLLLDREFYSVKVIRYLIRRKQPFIMPACKKGKKADKPGGPTGTQAWALCNKSQWARYTLTSDKDGTVCFDLAVVCINQMGQRGKKGRQTLLYATWGLTRRPLDWIRQTYRRRFGIEASYRQIHQAKIKTSSRNPAIRLLFIGVAFILRNVWVWFHAEVIALPRKRERILNQESLRFQRMLLWLLTEVAERYNMLEEIPIPRDLQQVAQQYGINLCH